MRWSKEKEYKHVFTAQTLLLFSVILPARVCLLIDTARLLPPSKSSSKMGLNIGTLGILSPGLAALSIIGLLVVYEAGWIVYSRCFHPLSKIPGPWLASVSRTWYMLQGHQGGQ